MRSLDERNALVDRYMPTALRVARAWGSTADTREEAAAECSLSLVEVIDATPDALLSEPYVATSMRNHLRSVHALSTRDSVIPAAKMLSLDELVRFEDGSEAVRSATIADPNSIDPESAVLADEEEASAEQLRNLLSRLMGKLPIKQRRSLSMVYGVGGSAPFSVTATAARLGVSRVTVYKYLELAVETLRTGFAAAGYSIAPADFEAIVLDRAA